MNGSHSAPHLAPPTPPIKPTNLTNLANRQTRFGPTLHPTLHPRLLPVLLALCALLGGLGVSRLELRTSLVELLPSQDPAVRDLERTQARVGDMHLLLVGIRSPDRAANLRYAAELTTFLHGLPPTVCQLAAKDVRDLRQFFIDHRWLYASEATLRDLRDRLAGELTRRKNPLFVTLDDADDSDDVQHLGALPTIDSPLASLDQRFPGGDFVQGDYAWVATLPPGGMLSDKAGEALLQAVESFIGAHPPSSYQAQMTVLSAGPVIEALKNRQAVERDVAWVTAVCMVVIGASLALAFRSFFALPLLVGPALFGALLAFGAAGFAFGYLNASTAFLGSIIVGNGINPAIILLARYRDRRGAGASPGQAAAEASQAVRRSTLAASLAAAAAYASLMLTGFRGFSQFGFMAAFGSIACWAVTFAVLPTLLPRFDRWVWRARPKGSPSMGSASPRLAARTKPRWRLGAGTVLAAATLLTVVTSVGLNHFLRAPFEYDFRKLGTTTDRDTTYRQFDTALDSLFGRWHSPTVLLADRLDQVEQMRRAIVRQDDPARPTVGQVVTIYDILPGTPQEQTRKLALLAELRKLAHDPAVALLDEASQATLRKETPPESLAVLGPNDLPPLAQRPFTETDGSVGRPVLVYHAKNHVSMWNGRDLLAMSHVMEVLHLEDGTTIRSSGPSMIFGAMLRSILHDGPRATLLSLLGVLAVTLAMVRPLRTALLAFGALLLGTWWLVGTAGLVGVRITFLNYIALPITFGVGIEYAINVLARLSQEPDPAEVATTGRAVTLCSWTTVVGYGSLLAARSRALQGFGAMAILGEVACLLAAAVVLPALLQRARRRQPSEAGAGSS